MQPEKLECHPIPAINGVLMIVAGKISVCCCCDQSQQFL
jgi:hypothetical protein